MALREQLNELLAQHGLTEPDGRPLYAYRASKESFQRMREALREELRISVLIRGYKARAFCLLAAHFIHREATCEEVWNWQPVRDFCGVDCTYSELQDAVEEGLRYWKRALIRDYTGRQFLLTLLIEGGLPLAFVRQEGASLRTYLRSVLRDKETFSHRDIIELARASDTALPITLRRREVHELCGALVEVIAALRRHAPKPADALRLIQDPAWSVKLPMALDDALVLDLLGGLIREPRAARTQAQLEIETVLRLGTNAGLERRVRAPAFLDAQLLAASIGRRPDELPGRLYVAMEVCDGGRQVVATITRNGDEYSVSLGRYRPVVSHHLVREEVQFIISTGAEELGRFVPPGGAAFSESPLVFRDEGLEARLVSTGSYRTSAGSLLVLVPSETAVRSVDGSVALEGEIEAYGRKLYRVVGAATVSADGEAFAFRTNQPDVEHEQILLRGEPGGCAWSGQELTRQPIRVWSVSSTTGVAVRASQQALSWRPKGVRAPWRPFSEDCVGDVELRLRELSSGETVARTRARVLPADLRIQIRPAKEPTRGELRVSSRCLKDAGVRGSREVTANVTRGERGEHRVELTRADSTVARVHLVLNFLGGSSIGLDVPFPAEQATFLARDGAPMANEALVSLDRLVGTRALVVSPSPDRWALEARVEGSWRRLRALPRLGELSYGLHLEDVRGELTDLLATTSRLDSSVRLRLTRETGAVRAAFDAKIAIGRYDIEFMVEKEDRRTTLSLGEASRQVLGQAAVESLRVVSLPLWKPATPARELCTQGAGVWKFEHEGLEGGPWLLLGFQGDYLRIRPLLVTIQGAGPASGLTPLQTAIIVGNAERRNAAIDEVLDRLAFDPGDKDWPIVLAMLRTLGTYPAPTFDVVVRLARHPRAVALALLLANSSDRLRVWEGLQELPFLWHLIPTSAWISGAHVLRESLRTALEPIGLDWRKEFREQLKDLWSGALASPVTESLQEVLGAACVLELATQTKIESACDAKRREQFLAFVRPEGMVLQSLLQSHARDSVEEEWWPEPPFDTVLAARPLVARMVEPLAKAWRSQPRHRQEVLRAPLLAAAVAVAGGKQLDPSEVFMLRQVRDFDIGWFDQAYALFTSVLLGERLATKKEPFDA